MKQRSQKASVETVSSLSAASECRGKQTSPLIALKDETRQQRHRVPGYLSVSRAMLGCPGKTLENSPLPSTKNTKCQKKKLLYLAPPTNLHKNQSLKRAFMLFDK